MRRSATTLLVLLAVVTAGVPAAHAAPQTRSHTTEPAQDTDLRECFDGRCTITVRKPVSFKISKRFGFTRLRISRHGLSVKVTAKGPDVAGTAILARGGITMLNNLSIRIVSIKSTEATVRLTPVG